MTDLSARPSCILLVCICMSCLYLINVGGRFTGTQPAAPGELSGSRGQVPGGRAPGRGGAARRAGRCARAREGGGAGPRAGARPVPSAFILLLPVPLGSIRCHPPSSSSIWCHPPPSGAIRRHAAETRRGAEPTLVHHRRGRHRRRAPGRGGAGSPPWRFPPAPRTGTTDGCGVSAGRWAATLDGLPLSSLLCAPGPGCAGHSPESGQPPLAPLLWWAQSVQVLNSSLTPPVAIVADAFLCVYYLMLFFYLFLRSLVSVISRCVARMLCFL